MLRFPTVLVQPILGKHFGFELWSEKIIQEEPKPDCENNFIPGKRAERYLQAFALQPKLKQNF
jgi:hypothetical protein